MVVLVLVCAALLCGAAAALVCMGIGAWVEKLLKVRNAGPLESFWFGLAGMATILETYHLVRPIDAAIGLFLFAAGAVGFVVLRRGPRIVAAFGQVKLLEYLIYGTLLVVIALRTATPCKFFDTGLYGAQTIQWLTRFPAVPGLANLHGRFGFNSSMFLLMALLHHGVLTSMTYRLPDALMLAMLLAPVTAACLRLARVPANPTDRGVAASTFNRIETWFTALLIFPLTYRVFESSEISDLVGTDTDLPAMLVALAAIRYLLSVSQTDSLGEERGAVRTKLLCADALLALAVVIKASLIVLSGTCWVFGLVLWRSSTSGPSSRWSAWSAYFILPFAIIIPWMAHGLILSGYPVYPSSLLGAPVDWRVSSPSLNLVTAGIRAWARVPHAVLSETTGVQWIGPWLRNNRGNRAELIFPVLFALAGALLLLKRPAPGAEARSEHRHAGLWLLIPLGCGLAFWFGQAPALRFGQAALWGTACILGACGLNRAVGNSRWAGRFVLAGTLLSVAWSLYPRTLWQRSFAPLAQVHQLSPLPFPEVRALETRYGVEIYVSRDGSQQTWESPLPSSAYLNPTLRLRRSGDLRSGFTSDGLPRNAEWVSVTSELPVGAAR